MSSNTSNTSRSGALVSGRGHLSWLNTIRSHLSVEKRELLNASCFGHLLSIPDIQFQGQLYHVLIKKLEKSSLPRQRLSFRINNRVIEFGPREFSLMTGLSMYGWEEPPSDSEFHETYFHGRTDLVFSDIQKSFIRECEATAGDSLDAFKLALLYIVYGILLICAKKSKRIDLKYFHLIDDLEKFNRFAWGQVSYEFLVRTAHRARDILDNLIAEGKTLAYDANGFAIALQTWAYEVMPNLARGCAMRVPGMEDQNPRMLRWASSKHFRFERINRYFTAKNAGAYPVDIILSDKEHEMLNFLGVNDITLGPLARRRGGEVIYKHRKLLKKCLGSDLQRNGKQNLHVPQRKSLRLEGTACPGVPAPETSLVISGLLKRVASLEKNLKGLKAAVRDPSGASIDAGLDDDDHPEYDVRGDSNPIPAPAFPTVGSPVGNESVTGVIPGEVPVSDDLVEHNHSAAAVLNNDPPSYITAVGEQLPSQTDVESPFIMIGNASGIPVLDAQHDPRDLDVDHTVLDEFESWYNECSRKTESESILLLNGIHADADWFSFIWTGRYPLRDDHIDSLINVLVWMLKDAGQINGERALVEMICWNPLISDNFELVSHFVEPYAWGRYPTSCPVQWQHAKRVYGIGNIGKHWVAYEILLEGQCIKVYDPSSTSRSWESLLTPFHNMSINIPKLCAELHIWDEKHMTIPLHPMWDVIQVCHPPQQLNNFDCGIMVIKFLECLLCGRDVSVLDSERCGMYRRSYCAKLYEISVGEPVDA
ncbi:hypothetical protein C2S51_025158 [Perilla frutescens var. frutescens]|nr:hypothetical protein C2S51_025158 [Perilla frutescens var. frutescens]